MRRWRRRRAYLLSAAVVAEQSHVACPSQSAGQRRTVRRTSIFLPTLIHARGRAAAATVTAPAPAPATRRDPGGTNRRERKKRQNGKKAR